MRIGIVSDTHGLLRAEVLEHFAGVEHILHGGDIGDLDLLTELQSLAPVTAVWGNTDDFDVRQRVPEVARLVLGGVEVVVIHGQQFGSPTPEKVARAHPEAGLVVFGHTHRAIIERVDGALVVNPGGAGHPRFGVAPTIALAEIGEDGVSARLVSLDASRK